MKLNTLFTGRNFITLDEVESTQSFALDLLGVSPAEGTVVLAHHQTAGRGQRSNRWLTEPGLNLTFSLILYPAFLPAAQVFHLNRLAAVALVRALRSFVSGGNLAIKWPNDILLNEKKICGMIADNSLSGGKISSSVLGIGINVNQDIFSEAYGNASSLKLETGITFETEAILAQVLEALEAEYLALRAGQTAKLEKEYLSHLFGWQEFRRFRWNGAEHTAAIAGVDTAGRLALEHEGKLLYFHIKEVEFCL